MASSKDFKKLFDKYQEEGAPKGVSIVKYWQMNGTVHSQFERWYKYSRAGIVKPVEIVGKDGLMRLSETSMDDGSFSSTYITEISLVFSNGMEIVQHNITYLALRQIIEKLEALQKYGLDVKDYLINAFREVIRGNQDCSTYAPEAVAR